MTASRLTDDERAAYRRAKREDAERRLQQLVTEEGWAAWLRLRRALHEFSFTNQVLIAIQAHERDVTPTFVKAKWRWRSDGYHPAKGSRSYMIFTPFDRRRKDRQDWICCERAWRGDNCGRCGRPRVSFHLKPVFDAADVRSFETGEPPDLHNPKSEPITGTEPGIRLLEPLAAHALQHGWIASVDLHARSEHGEGGSWNRRTRHLRVCGDCDGCARSPNGRLRTLTHELAHSLDPRAHVGLDLSYAEGELLAECVSYLVAASGGLDTSGEAIPYMAGWGGEQAPERVHELARLIDQIARRLEEPILALLATRENTSLARAATTDCQSGD